MSEHTPRTGDAGGTAGDADVAGGARDTVVDLAREERADLARAEKGERAPTVTVVVPAFNEAEAIGDVIADVRSTLGHDTDVVVVDDGSGDGTAFVARRAGARVVEIPENAGNGAAVKAGIRAATGEFVALMDGDGQHRAEDLRRLLDHAGPYDMVVGARDALGQASIGRRAANAVFNGVASYMTDRRIDDLTSGFRVVRRRVAEEFLPLLPNTFSYPTTITLASMRAGYSVKYVPIEARRRVGTSKIEPVRDGTNFLLIMFKVVTLFSPLKVFLPLALVPALATLLAVALSVVGWSDLWTLGAVTGSSALTVLGLGLVSEQITAMRVERISLAAEEQLARVRGVEEVAA